MNLKLIATATAATAICAAAVVDAVKTTRQERAKREQIILDSEAEKLAIKRSYLIMADRINAGMYGPGQLDQVFTDLKFYRMTARYEN